jgi:hypothetical protein
MAAMRWWRKVHKANISQADRDQFERYGETVVALLLANQLTESPETKEHRIRVGVLGFFQKVIVDVDAAAAWLTERTDLAERREDRHETADGLC